MDTEGHLIIDESGFIFREYNSYGHPELLGKILLLQPYFKVFVNHILLSGNDLKKIGEFIEKKHKKTPSKCL